MRDLTDPEKTHIEGLIDACGLAEVLGAIFEICHEKAAHIRESYIDETLANLWSDAGERIGRTSNFAATRKL